MYFHLAFSETAPAMGKNFMEKNSLTKDVKSITKD